MSDARQAISAARDARADHLAPQVLDNAQKYLEQASRQLDRGHYAKAREAARFAKQEAVRARDLAVHTAGKM